ncbi:IclR family transcriptional regulator [Acetobacteraceae bacterium H6797]|nr:IclR family transcriptional regulator [Acetobacteraceae bacterium H6797]
MPDSDPEAETTPPPARSGSEITAVMHAILALQCIGTQEEELGVNEIARRIGVHKSTASRLLATLESAGFVARSPETGRFNIGIGLISLVSPFLAQMEVVKAARPVLSHLALDLGETASLGLWTGAEVVMVEQTQGSRPIGQVIRAGGRLPAHATAAGKILLAHLPEAELEAFLAHPLHAETESTRTSREALLPELQAARQRGYAVNVEEHMAGACGIATLIRDAAGHAAASLTLSIPRHRFDEARQAELARRLKRDALEISRRLGWQEQT